MSEKKETKFEPDYNKSCENCGQTPVVTQVNSKGKVIRNFKMCGPCMFGDSSCVDPGEW